MQAACAGNLDSLKHLIRADCALEETGHFLSCSEAILGREEQNNNHNSLIMISITSNVIGAAAYYGHVDILSYCLDNLNDKN